MVGVELWFSLDSIYRNFSDSFMQRVVVLKQKFKQTNKQQLREFLFFTIKIEFLYY